MARAVTGECTDEQHVLLAKNQFVIRGVHSCLGELRRRWATWVSCGRERETKNKKCMQITPLTTAPSSLLQIPSCICCSEGILCRTLSRSWRARCRVISIQHGVSLMLCLRQSGPHPLTKLSRRIHRRLRSSTPMPFAILGSMRIWEVPVWRKHVREGNIGAIWRGDYTH